MTIGVTEPRDERTPTTYAFACQSDPRGSQGSWDNLVVYVPGGVGVRGCVSDAEGKLLSGVLIDPGESGPNIAFHTGTTGRYWHQELEPRTYRMSAIAEGYEVDTRTVTVKEGHAAVLDFVLEPQK